MSTNRHFCRKAIALSTGPQALCVQCSGAGAGCRWCTLEVRSGPESRKAASEDGRYATRAPTHRVQRARVHFQAPRAWKPAPDPHGVLRWPSPSTSGTPISASGTPFSASWTPFQPPGTLLDPSQTLVLRCNTRGPVPICISPVGPFSGPRGT